MTTQTITSDPAAALELGRRLALKVHRPQRKTSRLGEVWNHWFIRSSVKPVGRQR